MTSQHEKYSLAFVLGASHCGSTLLGRMLDMHSHVFCPGELLWLDDALERNIPCSCGEAIKTCPFWSKQLPSFPEEILARYKKTNRGVFEDLRERLEKKIIVDLSKSRVFRVKKLWKRDNGPLAMILLVRDPRALIASRMREGGEINHEIRKNRKWIKRFQEMIDHMGPHGLTLFYEDFVNEPEKFLRTVGEFLGLEYTPTLMNPADREHHFIHSSVSPYLRGKNEIRIDERWRKELSADQIALINRKMRKVDLYRQRYDLNDA